MSVSKGSPESRRPCSCWIRVETQSSSRHFRTSLRNCSKSETRGHFMYFFFDTETTGLARNWKAPVSDVANWPRVVQLAWVECDESGTIISEAEWIIRPDGYTIPVEASRIHGITMEKAVDVGVPMAQALAAFAAAVALHS